MFSGRGHTKQLALITFSNGVALCNIVAPLRKGVDCQLNQKNGKWDPGRVFFEWKTENERVKLKERLAVLSATHPFSRSALMYIQLLV